MGNEESEKRRRRCRPSDFNNSREERERTQQKITI